MPNTSHEATRLLILASRGDQEAAEQVMPLIYRQLHRLARERTIGRRFGQRVALLSPTELVHEAYLKLMDGDGAVEWEDRQHFFAVAAMVMRRLALDDLRRQGRLKRGEGWVRITLDEAARQRKRVAMIDPLDLADALKGLAEREPRQAMVAEWRVFVGLPHAHIAKLLGVSERTVHADWALARAHLARTLRGKTK